jgi:2',3'-cyclic-nucleotide 2'-phosphodiesterase (5'-nucleotidase family)
LNVGGIRSTINKGPVSIGDMFKLMPFDNEIVWVELPVSVIPEIEEYLKKSGGEPISNAILKNGKLVFNNWNENSSSFWVITSDYLMNGGDKMNFFAKKLSVNKSGTLMRDALITEARFQTVIEEDTTIRISF